MASLTSVRFFVAVIFVLSLTLATEGTVTKCDKINACSCKSNEGVIDLKPLDGTSTKPSLTAIDEVSGYTYYYNPCTVFSYAPASPQCQGVLGCQYDQSFGGFTIGKLETVRFEVEGGNVKITMTDGLISGRQMEVK